MRRKVLLGAAAGASLIVLLNEALVWTQNELATCSDADAVESCLQVAFPVGSPHQLLDGELRRHGYEKIVLARAEEDAVRLHYLDKRHTFLAPHAHSLFVVVSRSDGGGGTIIEYGKGR